MKTYVVEYYENTVGVGGEIWYSRYPTKDEAKAAVEECNAVLPQDGSVPSYYIVARYIGPDGNNNPLYDKIYQHVSGE